MNGLHYRYWSPGTVPDTTNSYGLTLVTTVEHSERIMYVQYLPMLDERLVQVLDVDVPVGFVVFHVAHFGA
jgi:hypothetical protein